MNRLRTIAIAALIAAFAITAIGTFALAAPSKTRLTIVNGWPGKKVDICLNGNPQRSGLGYGRKILRSVSNSKKTLKFYSDNGRTCGGTLLGKKTFDPPNEGLDLTLVLTPKPRHKAKRVLLFDNARWYEDLDPGEGVVTLRNAASIGKLDIYIDIQEGPFPVGPGPALHSPSPSPWAKGDEAGGSVEVGEEFDRYRSVATKHGKSKVIAKTPFRGIKIGKRDEHIVLGTNLKNVKITRFYAPAPKPSPTAAP